MDQFTFDDIAEIIAKAEGVPAEHFPRIKRQVRYLHTLGLYNPARRADGRGMQTFGIEDVYRARVFNHLMDEHRADRDLLAAAKEAAAEFVLPDVDRLAPSCHVNPLGGLLDSIRGVQQGESWSLVFYRRRPLLSGFKTLVVRFGWEGARESENERAVDAILGESTSFTRSDLGKLYAGLPPINFDPA